MGNQSTTGTDGNVPIGKTFTHDTGSSSKVSTPSQPMPAKGAADSPSDK